MPYSPQDILAGRQYAAQQDNSDQLQKVASASMSYGDELAIRKIAAMENEAKEEKEAKEKEEKGEHPKLSDEEKKEASAMGMFAFEGYINKLAEAGDLIYGDPSVYIRKLAEQRGAYEKVATMADGLKAGWEATKAYGSNVGHAMMNPRALGREATGMGVRAGAGGAYGMGAGALLGAGTGALASDDAGTGALYGAGIGALGGGAAGAGLGMAGPSIRSAIGSFRGGKHLVEDAQAARAAKTVARRDAQARTQDARLFGKNPPSPREGTPMMSEAERRFYAEQGKGASNTLMDALLQSRANGILSQY